jgi:hypothetical protein
MVLDCVSLVEVFGQAIIETVVAFHVSQRLAFGVARFAPSVLGKGGLLSTPTTHLETERGACMDTGSRQLERRESERKVY